MLNTNLLPLEEKERIRADETRRLIIFFAAASSGIFLIGALLFAPAYIGAVLERREAERLRALEEEAARKLGIREELSNVEKAMHSIELAGKYLGMPNRASIMVEEFVRGAEGITVTNLTLKKNGEFSLTGQARTRRELLDFERQLRGSGRFQEFSFPVSNLIRETEINFSLQGALVPASRF